MASAGTARYPPPAFTFQVATSRLLLMILVGLHSVSLMNILGWFYSTGQVSQFVLGISIVAWVVAAMLSAFAYIKMPTGRLLWDTASWHFERNLRPAKTTIGAEVWGVNVEVALDLQFCMLLKYGQNARPHWIFAVRRHDAANWLALRRAVYSPAMDPRFSSRSEEIGTSSRG